jgi:hypothetical protein
VALTVLSTPLRIARKTGAARIAITAKRQSTIAARAAVSSLGAWLDWIRLLLAEDLAPEDLRQDPVNLLPRLHGALLKNEQDMHLFERLAFMARARRS